MNWAIPSPDQQIVFLGKIQRLFSEADFAATYKFALLMSLADLAVEFGEDSGSPLTLSMAQVAEHFISLYWPQIAPYSTGIPGTSTGVLLQNRGRQAAVIRMLGNIRSLGSISAARADNSWNETVRQVASIVRGMPINFLQNVGGETNIFLYRIPAPREPLQLLPGIGYCLRKFHGFIHQLSKTGWIEHVRSNSRNRTIIGTSDDLESFMFGTSRQPLQIVSRVLMPLQKGRCFYCDQILRQAAEVDHFIPWSTYPRDTVHNFVLAHSSCNNDKRDMLAGYRHLERWLDRNTTKGENLTCELGEAGFMADLETSKSVAKWAYRQSVTIGAHGWIAKGADTEAISERCMALF